MNGLLNSTFKPSGLNCEYPGLIQVNTMFRFQEHRRPSSTNSEVSRHIHVDQLSGLLVDTLGSCYTCKQSCLHCLRGRYGLWKVYALREVPISARCAVPSVTNGLYLSNRYPYLQKKCAISKRIEIPSGEVKGY